MTDFMKIVEHLQLGRPHFHARYVGNSPLGSTARFDF
jgi:hypothetical protein